MKPLTLIILDGWGYREEREHNAIQTATIPTWEHLWKHHPHCLLSASGSDVGLPPQQMGNSEVGHLTIGAGRTVFQELPRIDKAIQEGDFFSNPIFTQAFDDIAQTQQSLHLVGLVSKGGVHSHEAHLIALIQLAKARGIKHLFIHAILDGRDTPPISAKASIEKIEAQCRALSIGKIASLCGRYYAMDRDKRWERTRAAYDLLVCAEAPFYSNSASEALQSAYERGETDEFVKPTIIHDAHPIQNGDAFVFFNFRADRARQLSRALLQENFKDFIRQKTVSFSHFISMTPYANDIPSEIAFQSQPLSGLLGECIAHAGLSQLRIAETEKYAHVTFFFNGGREQAYPNEARILIPSPAVSTYDLQPEMSAEAITAHLVEAIQEKKYDFIVCNFANPDMLGHTGNFEATQSAIETIDRCLKRIIEASQAKGAEVMITADHGNAECMYNTSTQQAHTAHTEEPVPFLFIGREAVITKEHGILADIAPTALYLLGLPKPKEMTGTSLLKIKE